MAQSHNASNQAVHQPSPLRAAPALRARAADAAMAHEQDSASFSTSFRAQQLAEILKRPCPGIPILGY